MTGFSELWREKRLLTLGFGLAAIITLLVAVRLVFSIVYWQTHADMALEPWMRLGYVARSHGVAVEGLRTAAGLPAEERDRRTLAEIADSEAIPVSGLIDRLNTEIARQKSGDAAPGTPSAPPAGN